MKLQKFGISGKLRWLKYPTDRMQCVSINNSISDFLPTMSAVYHNCMGAYLQLFALYLYQRSSSICSQQFIVFLISYMYSYWPIYMHVGTYIQLFQSIITSWLSAQDAGMQTIDTTSLIYVPQSNIAASCVTTVLSCINCKALYYYIISCI